MLQGMFFFIFTVFTLPIIFKFLNGNIKLIVFIWFKAGVF